jgi:hypothetical protein
MSAENSIPLSEHERFEQMCALLALGELPEEDFKELQRHLTECAPCQQLYEDFCRIGSDDLGFVAANRHAESPVAAREAAPYLDRLYRRISLEHVPTPKPSLWRRMVALPTNPMFAWSAALALVIAVGGFAYFRYQQAATATQTAEAQSQWLRAQLAQTRKQVVPKQVPAVPAADPAVTELRQELAEANAKNAEWQTKAAELTKQLSEASARADLAARDLEQAQTASQTESDKRSEAEQQLRSALQQMKDLRDQRTEAVLRASDQEHQISELKSQLASQSAALERTETEIAGTGLDGKNLFGARNLHIVDVYDVDGRGNTKRTFGRVYYVEKKLLVFYAFDLEAKRRNQLAAGFQAWGYREVGSTKPENLGMFHLDDPALNRWTLSVNDPRVLEHIDAVFVTLEPPEGSPTPKGRRLLYASLAGTPNHP